MEHHINDVCRVCYHHLRNIGLMKKKLTTDSMKTLVQALILSRLDLHNALYFGLPNILLDKGLPNILLAKSKVWLAKHLAGKERRILPHGLYLESLGEHE